MNSMMWRLTKMNEQDQKIVDYMIQFVESTEKNIQAAKMSSGSKTKAVSVILKELEKQFKNEN